GGRCRRSPAASQGRREHRRHAGYRYPVIGCGSGAGRADGSRAGRGRADPAREARTASHDLSRRVVGVGGARRLLYRRRDRVADPARLCSEPGVSAGAAPVIAGAPPGNTERYKAWRKALRWFRRSSPRFGSSQAGVTTLVALFFILISGETFLRRLVEILPRFKNKRQVVDISQEIEDDLSVYL